jgi:hypothetical protein
MLSYLLYILQPLNIGCFSPLKRAYGAKISAGVQLSKVTEKLNGVTDGVGESWTGLPMEPPGKGRRGYTFTYTERALVATFNLSDRTNQNT